MSTELLVDRFKEAFKYYKSKNPAPDFSTVIKIRKNCSGNNLQPINLETSCLDSSFKNVFIQNWEAFELTSCPGLLFIKNPFTSMCQRYLITRCLRDYPSPPNRTNLNTKPDITLEAQNSWWNYLNQVQNKEIKTNLKNALRWTTLGYHHDWDTKVYNEQMQNEFPKDLKDIIYQIANVLGYKNYQAEAAIINYYPQNTTLAGHTDHSEHCNEPLFSISLGQSAIFLIGGPTKDISPQALLLESGDIVVMTKESRLSYHAIPKILNESSNTWNFKVDRELEKIWPETFNHHLTTDIMKTHFFTPFQEYISQCRININVRQVYSK